MIISELITALETKKKEIGDVKVVISGAEEYHRIDSVFHMGFTDGKKLAIINQGTWVVPERYYKL